MPTQVSGRLLPQLGWMQLGALLQTAAVPVQVDAWKPLHVPVMSPLH